MATFLPPSRLSFIGLQIFESKKKKCLKVTSLKFRLNQSVRALCLPTFWNKTRVEVNKRKQTTSQFAHFESIFGSKIGTRFGRAPVAESFFVCRCLCKTLANNGYQVSVRFEISKSNQNRAETVN